MMRRICFLISIFIVACAGVHAAAAPKDRLDFEGRTSWFYIISDGKYLVWDSVQEMLKLTECAPLSNSQWTLDRDGRVYNRARGEKYSIGSNKLVPTLARKGKAVLRDGCISCVINDDVMHLGLSDSGVLMFLSAPSLTFITQPVEIHPLNAELPERIARVWEGRVEASIKEIERKWCHEYDLVQFSKPLKFKAPYQNAQLKELFESVQRASVIIKKVQGYAENGKRGSWVSIPVPDYYSYSKSIQLDQDFVRYSGGYYVCRTINGHFPQYLSWIDEDYSYGMQPCLGRPISNKTYKISKKRWIITYDEQVQVNAVSSGRGDGSVLHPVKMLDRAYGYKQQVKKTGTYSSTYNLWGISVPAKVTCSRKYWQTYRVGRPDCPWEQEVLGPRTDPFAPWRIKQTIVFEFDIDDYLKHVRWIPKELTAIHLLEKALELSSKYGWQGRCLPIAVLKTYSNELRLFTDFDTSEDIWRYVKNMLSQFVSEKQIKKAVLIASACPDGNVLEYVCEKIFISCKTPDELLDAFSDVYAVLYGKRIPTEDFATFAFAGLTWPGFQPMSTEKEVIPSYLRPYVKKRDELFSDYANVEINDSDYYKAFHSYMFNLLIFNNTDDTEMLAKVNACSNQKFCSDILDYLSQKIIPDLQTLVASYADLSDIDTFSHGLQRLDFLVNSGRINKPSNYDAMRQEAIADVSKLLPERLVSVFNDFDSHWLNGMYKGISSAADQLSKLKELNMGFFEGALLDENLVRQCDFRLDAYEILMSTDKSDISRFVEKWGANNLYVDTLSCGN